MKTKINLRVIVLLLLIVIAAGMRLVNTGWEYPLSNFTPIGAMALFGGAYFTARWKSLLFPLLALFLSDIFIQNVIYQGQYGRFLYSGWYWVYGVFALIVFIGSWLIRKVSVKNVLLAGVAASLAHWLITDLGVWLAGGLDITTGQPYTRDLSGLLKCLYLALPFLKNFFLGTVMYSAAMFGAFELAQRRVPALTAEAV
jgi:hypothetical protein